MIYCRTSIIVICGILFSLVLSGCQSIQHHKSLGSFTQEDWDVYYKKALKIYNDPIVWEKYGDEKKRPVKFVQYGHPFGERPGCVVHIPGTPKHDDDTPSNWVYIHIPVENIGKPVQGMIPCVSIVFEHPSGKVVAIYVSEVIF